MLGGRAPVQIGMLMLCAVFGLPVQGPVADKPVSHLQIEQFGFGNALADLARDTHTVIGLTDDVSLSNKSYRIDQYGGTVADALSSLATQAGSHSWRENQDGAIRVTDGTLPQSLAELDIDYKGAQKMTRRQIWESLSGVSEITTWLASNRCKRAEYFVGSPWGQNNDPISVPAGNITLGDLFDIVALKSGTDFWSIDLDSRGGSCKIGIYL